jgi:putative nucleotidyltransferase with HDIG domain
VAALYHDIGKISRPEYFVENQFGGPNPHDKLSPAMSALILFAHVKQGVELAEEYHLGREISDIIQQHHGTRGTMFFYNKALQMGENPRIEDFSYPGPRPQSKEAAIVMLADAVEASSRTLGDPTPARIRTHVTNIVKGVYAEGQLDESDLAFRDLDKIIDCFVRIITGHFHQRIAYPDAAKAKGEVEKAESEVHGEDAKASEASAKEAAAASVSEEAEAKADKAETGENAAQELKSEWVVPSADEHHGRALIPPRKGDM